MYLAYFDESGDDGYPARSSVLFVQSAVYLHHRHWRAAFEATRDFRRALAQRTPLPTAMELHTRELLLDKDPYHALRIQPALKPRLNLRASTSHPLGIVCYPKGKGDLGRSP